MAVYEQRGLCREVLMTIGLKDAYELVAEHNRPLADGLCASIRHAKANLKFAVDHKHEREEEYDKSLWQWATIDKYKVLRPLESEIWCMKERCYSCETDIVTAAEDIWNESIKRKEAQIDEGNFVYYVVDGRTSNRKHNDVGEPIIYATKTDAEYACVEYDEIISIAAYNRMYGRFMSA